MSEYGVNCPYGGLGNWMKEDTVCHKCDYNLECEHEKEMIALAAPRSRRSWPASQTRRPVRPTGLAAPPPQQEPLNKYSQRPRRPMPQEGEVPAVRLGKNMLAAGLSGMGFAVGDYCQQLLALPDTGEKDLLSMMGYAGIEAAGNECGEFFALFNFKAKLLDDGEDE
jgi:hypothetical protein